MPEPEAEEDFWNRNEGLSLFTKCKRIADVGRVEGVRSDQLTVPLPVAQVVVEFRKSR